MCKFIFFLSLEYILSNSVGLACISGAAIKLFAQLAKLLYLCKVKLADHMKVLFFSAWYPHRYDAMAGLFVRKHAEAVAAQGEDVAVFYLHEDKHIIQAEWVKQTTNGVHEFYYYYPASNRFAAYCNFWKCFLDGYDKILASWGKPDITQANVLAKDAWCAYYLYKKYAIPYIVVEHWSGYLPQNGDYKGFWHKCITKHIARHAECILPVSSVLLEAMQQHGIKNKHWELLNNVVDDFFFETSSSKSQESRLFTFLHVSCFDEAAKNTCGIFRATTKLYKQRQDFQLIMVGTGQDIQLAKDTATELGLGENIIQWKGEVTPIQVAEYMRAADCFVLFSNYENAPVVLSECLAVGLPIITSRVGFVPQVITDEIGRIVEPRNEQQLTATMSWMMDNAHTFNQERIRQHGQAYSYESVGKHLCTIYQQYCVKA